MYEVFRRLVFKHRRTMQESKKALIYHIQANECILTVILFVKPFSRITKSFLA